MAGDTKFKTLQNIYVQKKLADDSYWLDMVERVQGVLEGFVVYLGTPPAYTSEEGRKEHHLRFVSFNDGKLVPLDAKQILKTGKSFDFRLDLALDAEKSDNERVSEIVSANISVNMLESGELSFMVGNPPKPITIYTRSAEPFYDAVYAVFSSEVQRKLTTKDIR